MKRFNLAYKKELSYKIRRHKWLEKLELTEE